MSKPLVFDRFYHVFNPFDRIMQKQGRSFEHNSVRFEGPTDALPIHRDEVAALNIMKKERSRRDLIPS